MRPGAWLPQNGWLLQLAHTREKDRLPWTIVFDYHYSRSRLRESHEMVCCVLRNGVLCASEWCIVCVEISAFFYQMVNKLEDRI